jgi:hypothetical protein
MDGKNGPVWLELARLGALVALDLVRPPRPENRLPKRWAPTAPRH